MKYRVNCGLLRYASAALLAAPLAQAQSVPAASSEAVEEIVVTGIRATQRDSIEVKRAAPVIVDALVSDEIGALPDQSVAETLERVTGVTADRFKGSASEISVRGLGPFLGFSTLNGREVSSGSGDRAVSFQQFPSELANGVLVYKTQQADFVEGGVSGVIELRTLRPLDLGRQRFLAEARGNYLPYDARIEDSDGTGYRASSSYVDQFDTGIGAIGVSVGYARTDTAAPEDFYTASSDFRPCNSINTAPTALSGGLAGANCNYNAAAANQRYFVANQYSFRQLQTGDERDAIMGALQWQPTDDLDINLDLQFSERASTEDRHDLVIAEGRRGIRPDEINAQGGLLQYRANSYLENVSTYRVRDEDYRGGGLSIDWNATAALNVSADLAYSRTHRRQVDRSARLRSNTIFGPGGRVAYAFDQRGGVPAVVFVAPIDLDNHAAYTTSGYARRRMEDRDDEILAARMDADYELGGGAFRSLEFGVRYSDHGRVTDLDNNNDVDPVTGPQLAAGNANCRVETFPQDDWMRDSGTNVRSWATFDTLCLYEAFAGTRDRGPLADSRSAGDIDVNERIAAAYAMANFNATLGGVPVSGNIGARVVRTDVTSRGYRGSFDVVTSGGTVRLVPIPGTFDPVLIENRFTNMLPSANLTFSLRPDLLLRLAAYRALARPNIEDMGAGREFVTEAGAATVEEAIAGVSGGNPRLEPLQSANADIALEWYPTPDTALTGAVYYKRLEAGIMAAYASSLQETFVIDGASYTVPVAQQKNSDDASDLYGFEVTAQHAFATLPAPFDGLGVAVAYNYADSNLEYEDPSAVDPVNPLRNFTAPAGIVGLSKHSGSATAFYEKGGVSLRLVYKYRSEYFKPFQLAANRYVEGAGFLDASLSYDVTEHLQLKLQALNLLEQEQVMYRPVDGSVAEASYYGTSYFVGVRVRY
jgi:iron complex outermembrane recepter protein